MPSPTLIYNPRKTEPDLLKRLAVGRDDLLDAVLADLRQQAGATRHRHWVIRGPRGIGKTHFSALVYYNVRSCPSLAASYLPIWLQEADVYEVYSTGTLLLSVAQQLSVEYRAHENTSSADAYNRALNRITAKGDDAALFDQLRSLLASEARARQRELLILMENLDALLLTFAPKQRSTEIDRLYSLLGEANPFVFISTTPTRYLPAGPIGKRLKGVFRDEALVPLTEHQVYELFQRLQRLEPHKSLAQAMARGRSAAVRRRVLHYLTGGNPRSVMMAFQVMAGAAGLKGVVDDFRSLLDSQTAYFEARLARLAARERVILTAMALATENLTMAEVAQTTRLPQRSLSTLIARLVEEGYVEMSAGSGGQRTIYEVSDGLFRFWYQFRKGRAVLEPLVKFLAYWYRPAELRATAAQVRAFVRQSVPPSGGEPAALMALAHVEEAMRLSASQLGKRERSALWKHADGDAERSALNARASLAHRQMKRRQYSKAIRLYRDVLDQDRLLGGRLGLNERAILTTNLGIALLLFDKNHESAGVFADVFRMCKDNRNEREDYRPLMAQVSVFRSWALIATKQLRNAGSAIRQAFSLTKSIKDDDVRAEIATGGRLYGDALADHSKIEQAIDAFSLVEKTFGESTDPETLDEVANAMCKRAMTLAAIRKDESVDACKRVFDRFSASDRKQQKDAVAGAFFALVVFQGEKEERADVIETVQEVIPEIEKRRRRSEQVFAYGLRLALAMNRVMAGHNEQARREMSELIHRATTSRAPADVSKLFAGSAKELLKLFPAAWAEDWFGQLKEAERDLTLAEVHRLNETVARVLGAVRQRPSGDDTARQKRIEHVLGRIPQGIRGAVRDVVEELLPELEVSDRSSITGKK